jgi:hypothetical protein
MVDRKIQLDQVYKLVNEQMQLVEMRDALELRISTYDVTNLSYSLLDHRADCKIFVYLKDKIQNRNFDQKLIRIMNQSRSSQVDDAEIDKVGTVVLTKEVLAAISGTNQHVVV